MPTPAPPYPEGLRWSGRRQNPFSPAQGDPSCNSWPVWEARVRGRPRGPGPGLQPTARCPLTSALCSLCTNSSGGVPVTFMISFSWSRSRLRSGAQRGTRVRSWWRGAPAPAPPGGGESRPPPPQEEGSPAPRPPGGGEPRPPPPRRRGAPPGSRWRIRSLPLKSVFPVIISAMMQPTDQMSTGTKAPASGLGGLGRGAHTDGGGGGGDRRGSGCSGGGAATGAISPPGPARRSPARQAPNSRGAGRAAWRLGRGGPEPPAFLTRLRVAHPIQDDLRCPVPARHHIPSHLAVGLSGQAEVQDLWAESGRWGTRGGGARAACGPGDPKRTGHTRVSRTPSGL